MMLPDQSPEPTCEGASVLRLSVWIRHVPVPTWPSFFRQAAYATSHFHFTTHSFFNFYLFVWDVDHCPNGSI